MSLWPYEPNPPCSSLRSPQYSGGSWADNQGEFIQSIGHARGSLLEIETQLIVARRLGYLDNRRSEDLLETASEVGKLANGLIRSLRRGSSS